MRLFLEFPTLCFYLYLQKKVVKTAIKNVLMQITDAEKPTYKLTPQKRLSCFEKLFWAYALSKTKCNGRCSFVAFCIFHDALSTLLQSLCKKKNIEKKQKLRRQKKEKVKAFKNSIQNIARCFKVMNLILTKNTDKILSSIQPITESRFSATLSNC